MEQCHPQLISAGCGGGGGVNKSNKVRVSQVRVVWCGVVMPVPGEMKLTCYKSHLPTV